MWPLSTNACPKKKKKRKKKERKKEGKIKKIEEVPSVCLTLWLIYSDCEKRFILCVRDASKVKKAILGFFKA